MELTDKLWLNAPCQRKWLCGVGEAAGKGPLWIWRGQQGSSFADFSCLAFLSVMISLLSLVCYSQTRGMSHSFHYVCVTLCVPF